MNRFALVFIIALMCCFNAFCSVISVADNQTYIIDENSSLNIERIEMGANSTLINNGTLIFESNFDFSYCYKTGVTFINNGHIECNNFINNINQWQWLPAPVQFVQNGSFLCHQDFDFVVSAYLVLSFGENASTAAKNVNIRKYGNQDLELLGSWLCDDMDITFNDGGRKIELGDIQCENFTLHNNAANLQLEGMAYIEHLSGETWGGAKVTVNGGLIIGDKNGNVSIKATEDSFVSLCFNPSSGKDYDINSNGAVCYRVQYGSDDRNYWNVSPKEENDVVGNAQCKANMVSYDECVEGYTHFLGIIDDSPSDNILDNQSDNREYYNVLGQKINNISSMIRFKSQR